MIEKFKDSEVTYVTHEKRGRTLAYTQAFKEEAHVWEGVLAEAKEIIDDLATDYGNRIVDRIGAVVESGNLQVTYLSRNRMAENRTFFKVVVKDSAKE